MMYYKTYKISCCAYIININTSNSVEMYCIFLGLSKAHTHTQTQTCHSKNLHSMQKSIFVLSILLDLLRNVVGRSTGTGLD